MRYGMRRMKYPRMTTTAKHLPKVRKRRTCRYWRRYAGAVRPGCNKAARWARTKN